MMSKKPEATIEPAWAVLARLSQADKDRLLHMAIDTFFGIKSVDGSSNLDPERDPANVDTRALARGLRASLWPQLGGQPAAHEGPGRYRVAVYFFGEEGEKQPVGVWDDVAGSRRQAYELALAEYEDPALETGWATEILDTPATLEDEEEA